MPLLNGMRGTVRNVKERTKAISSAAVVSPRKSLPAKEADRRPHIAPLAVESPDSAPSRSSTGRLVVADLDVFSKLVMTQPERREDAGADPKTKVLLVRASEHAACRG